MRNLLLDSLQVSLVETKTERGYFYPIYHLKITDPSGQRPEQLILAADLRESGEGVSLRRWRLIERAGRVILAAYLEMSLMGHDFDHWGLYDLESGEQTQDAGIEIQVEAETLTWSNWYTWEKLQEDVRLKGKGVILPDGPGVYEVKLRQAEEPLAIRKARCLSKSIRRLVRGKSRPVADEQLRAAEDTSQLVIRWAEPKLFSAVEKIEEELLRQHQARFGRRPNYK